MRLMPVSFDGVAVPSVRDSPGRFRVTGSEREREREREAHEHSPNLTSLHRENQK
jgi:hypothetical protein